MTTPTKELLFQLKEADQDFEWYPTTREMIHAVLVHLPKDAGSIMDIGAGDGRVLVAFAEKCEHAKLYSIEISAVLTQAQPPEIIPVGTDLFQQNLSCLEVDYIFCNPIYSQFEEWTCKIVAEGYAKKAYLVIPRRWKESKPIEQALKLRGATTKVIYSGDFLNAERQARAVIDIVEITYPKSGEYWDSKPRDPFDIWFDQNIDTFDQAAEVKDEEQDESALARKYAHASIDDMVAAYLEEYGLLEGNYRAIFKLDYAILKELGIDKKAVREGLKIKIAGLKVKYWQILFNRLDAITSRLTTKSKNTLLEKLTRNTSVEFTAQNAYAVVIWAIKNANQYFDDQAVQLFYNLSTFEGVLNYKSNQKTWERDGWRYGRRDEKHTHYKLDYRIVVSKWVAIDKEGGWNRWEYPGGLNRTCHELNADIRAVFSNLGFTTYSRKTWDREWVAGKWQNWIDDSPDSGDDEILFQAKAYLNGNVHYRFSQDAIKALNVQVGRILKWVRTEEDVVTELGYTREEAKKYFNHNPQILPSHVKLLNG